MGEWSICGTWRRNLFTVVGAPTIVIDGNRFAMKPGDTVMLPSRAEHGYMNPGRTTARLIGAARHITESS